tara:strand:- start:28 stop:210 length:183 start_codon:yes stop_codon:yes gene_type:complete
MPELPTVDAATQAEYDTIIASREVAIVARRQAETEALATLASISARKQAREVAEREQGLY